VKNDSSSSARFVSLSSEWLSRRAIAERILKLASIDFFVQKSSAESPRVGFSGSRLPTPFQTTIPTPAITSVPAPIFAAIPTPAHYTPAQPTSVDPNSDVLEFVRKFWNHCVSRQMERKRPRNCPSFRGAASGSQFQFNRRSATWRFFEDLLERSDWV
jgi:hypothetical protein